LFELVTVVGVIVVLAGFLVPAVSLGLQSAKRAEAKAFAVRLRTALEQYRTEYGEWPGAVMDFTNGDGDVEISVNGWGELYRSVCGYTNSTEGYTAANGSVNNVHQITFLEIAEKSLSSSASAPYVSGEFEAMNVVNILDPWNVPYHLVLDANGDGAVSVPDASGTQTLRASVAVWSNGGQNNKRIVASWK
jgi:type II secretory pathway pseudopilin PulG